MHRVVGVATAVLVLLSTGWAGAGSRRTIYDVAAEFSTARNPNGPWQYGFSTGTSLAPDRFELDRYPDTRDRIEFWHPAGGDSAVAGYYPYVAANASKRTGADPTNSWALRPGEVGMEGSNVGQYAVVRFVAPKGGRYRVKARFAGVHFRLSSTDVHVVVGMTSVFDAEIEGYGGDPSFHPVEGPAPRAAWSGAVDLHAGDFVSFAVGYGRNRTFFNDTTALHVRLRRTKSD